MTEYLQIPHMKSIFETTCTGDMHPSQTDGWKNPTMRNTTSNTAKTHARGVTRCNLRFSSEASTGEMHSKIFSTSFWNGKTASELEFLKKCSMGSVSFKTRAPANAHSNFITNDKLHAWNILKWVFAFCPMIVPRMPPLAIVLMRLHLTKNGHHSTARSTPSSLKIKKKIRVNLCHMAVCACNFSQ